MSHDEGEVLDVVEPATTACRWCLRLPERLYRHHEVAWEGCGPCFSKFWDTDAETDAGKLAAWLMEKEGAVVGGRVRNERGDLGTIVRIYEGAPPRPLHDCPDCRHHGSDDRPMRGWWVVSWDDWSNAGDSFSFRRGHPEYSDDAPRMETTEPPPEHVRLGLQPRVVLLPVEEEGLRRDH